MSGIGSNDAFIQMTHELEAAKLTSEILRREKASLEMRVAHLEKEIMNLKLAHLKRHLHVAEAT